MENKFEYGDIAYSLYDESEIEIIDRSDYKFVNNNPEFFTKDKELAEKFRDNIKYEEFALSNTKK